MRKYAGKVMATGFWDRRDVLLVDFMEKKSQQSKQRHIVKP
jgi:hypothetical protein